MLEMDFLFKNNTDKFRKKIEKIFEKCRPFSVEESGGNVKFTFGRHNYDKKAVRRASDFPRRIFRYALFRRT